MKILILLWGILGLAVSSFAESGSATLEDRKFYLKAIADRGFFKSSKLPRNGSTLKYKNNTAVNSMDLGAGYYFNKGFRGEILFHQEINNKFLADFKTANSRINKSTKNNLYALMLGVSMNVVNFEYGNIFLSGSLGVANIKEKINFHTTYNTSKSRSVTYNGENKNNIAYGVGVGADFKLSERLHAEVAYRFNDYGKTGSTKTTVAKHQIGHTPLRSHNALVGLRVDM